MRVERESCRMIKPTSIDGFDPQPHRLQSLSNFDLSARPGHVYVIYAFQAPTPSTLLLEGGLAKVLTKFREWAGRFTKDHSGRLAIDLNDEGVILIEACADGSLLDAMPFNPSPFILQLLPPINGVQELLLVQLTRFTCGGLVIGIARHHHVADGCASTVFMNAWGSIVRGHPIHSLPISYDRLLLAPRDPPQSSYEHLEYSNAPLLSLDPPDRPNLVVKRIHFNAEFLKELKDFASQDKPHTKFESLSAHLWRCISMARGLDGETTTKGKFLVNIRKRLKPALPVEYFGNATCVACPRTVVKELLEKPLHFAANLVHDSIARIDDEYVRSAVDFLELRFKGSSPTAMTPNKILSPDVAVTSWLNFAMYDLDFGWGNPVYVEPSLIPVEGLCFAIPSHTEDGSVDVVMELFAPDMAKFEQICYTI